MPSRLYPQAFYDTLASLKDVKQQLDILVESPEGTDTPDDWQSETSEVIESIQEKLSKNVFRVAFLAGSQVGKSTTINNLLGEQVLPNKAKGRSCSSVRIRIQKSSDEKPRIELQYYSRISFNQWLDTLCREADIRWQRPATYDSLLKEVVIVKEKAKTIQSEEIQELCQEIDRLARADMKYHDMLAEIDEGTVQISDNIQTFDDVASKLQIVATHPQSEIAGTASSHALVSEIRLFLPIDTLHPFVELIDLPGIGTTKKQDVVSSLGFLSELDGAVMMDSPEVVGNNEKTSRYISHLCRNEPNFLQRIWFGVSKVDTLAEHFFYDEEETLFDTLQELCQKLQLSPERLLMISNHYYEDRNTSIKLRRDTHGEIVWPNGLNRTPGLRPVYEDFVKDGGIGRLRNCVENQLYPLIRDKRMTETVVQFEVLCERLETRIRDIGRKFSLSAGSRDDQQKWIELIFRLTSSLKGYAEANRQLSDKLTAALDNSLISLDKRVLEATSHLPLRGETLNQNFDRLSKNLEHCLSEQLFKGESSFLKASCDLLLQEFKNEARAMGIEGGSEANSPASLFESRLNELCLNVRRSIKDPAQHLSNWSIPSEIDSPELPIDEYVTVMRRVVTQVMYETYQRTFLMLAEELEGVQVAIRSMRSTARLDDSQSEQTLLSSVLKQIKTLRGNVQSAKPIDIESHHTANIDAASSASPKPAIAPVLPVNITEPDDDLEQPEYEFNFEEEDRTAT